LQAIYLRILSAAGQFKAGRCSQPHLQDLAAHLAADLAVLNAEVCVCSNSTDAAPRAYEKLSWSTDHAFVVVHTGECSIPELTSAATYNFTLITLAHMHALA